MHRARHQNVILTNGKNPRAKRCASAPFAVTKALSLPVRRQHVCHFENHRTRSLSFIGAVCAERRDFSLRLEMTSVCGQRSWQ
jgi:hypothetical protein